MFLASPMLASAASISSTLDIGSTGGDVSTLQTYLATDVALYPQGLVTGYYGALSAAAVQRFQCRANLVCSGSAATTGYGRVGPLTRAALNAAMGGSVGTAAGDLWAPVINNLVVNKGSNNAIVTWTTNEAAQSRVHFSTSFPPMTEASASSAAVVGGETAGDGALSFSHSVNLANLRVNTTYYYVVQSVDAAGNVQYTWPMTFSTNN